MARQVGHLRYKGALGEVTHFKIKGLDGDFAGTKGGASAEQIKNSPSFARTRENNMEFGAAAKVGQSLRQGVNQLMSQMSDPQLTGRIVALMKEINREDKIGLRGERSFLISNQGVKLVNFQFNKNFSFKSAFKAPLVLSKTVGRDSSTLVIAAFDAKLGLKAPDGATHFRMINALSVLSDFTYNANSKSYEPTDIELNELSKVSYSDYLDVKTVLDQGISLTCTLDLPDGLELNPGVSVLNSIGIEFYIQSGEVYCPLNAGSALKVQKVY